VAFIPRELDLCPQQKRGETNETYEINFSSSVGRHAGDFNFSIDAKVGAKHCCPLPRLSLTSMGRDLPDSNRAVRP
jgi:hypothetical protein